jgi:hypothetical protein
VFERTPVVDDAVGDTGAKCEKEDDIFPDGLQTREAVGLLAKKCRDGAGQHGAFEP